MKHPKAMVLATTLLLCCGVAVAAENVRPSHASFQSLDDGSARTRSVPQAVRQFLDNGDDASMHRGEQSPPDRKR